MVSLYFMYYSVALVHQTLRVTPAMEAGIAYHVWSVEEMVGLLGKTGKEPSLNAFVSRWIAVCLLGSCLLTSIVNAQAPAPHPPSAVVLSMVTDLERALVGVAEEMPAEKYGFVPKDGNFRGVRTFLLQMKHAASVLHLAAAGILGEPITADMANERGPDAVRTKDDAVKYLKEGFAGLKRAAATVTTENAFEPFKGPFGNSDTRMGVIGLAVSHGWNHYGQVVPYLRMNGLAPPQ